METTLKAVLSAGVVIFLSEWIYSKMLKRHRKRYFDYGWDCGFNYGISASPEAVEGYYKREGLSQEWLEKLGYFDEVNVQEGEMV